MLVESMKRKRKITKRPRLGTWIEVKLQDICCPLSVAKAECGYPTMMDSRLTILKVHAGLEYAPCCFSTVQWWLY